MTSLIPGGSPAPVGPGEQGPAVPKIPQAELQRGLASGDIDKSTMDQLVRLMSSWTPQTQHTGELPDLGPVKLVRKFAESGELVNCTFTLPNRGPITVTPSADGQGKISGATLREFYPIITALKQVIDTRNPFY